MRSNPRLSKFTFIKSREITLRKYMIDNSSNNSNNNKERTKDMRVQITEQSMQQ